MGKPWKTHLKDLPNATAFAAKAAGQNQGCRKMNEVKHATLRKSGSAGTRNEEYWNTKSEERETKLVTTSKTIARNIKQNQKMKSPTAVLAQYTVARSSLAELA